MPTLDDLMAANAAYSSSYSPLPSRQPSLALALVTCLDTRIDPLAAFGLVPGEACVLRNAGARVTDDLVRSLAVAVHLLGVRTLALIQHSDCGMEATEAELCAATGLPGPLGAIEDHERALAEDLTRVMGEPSLAPLRSVGTFVLDPTTGRLRAIDRQDRSAR